jgi:hypothetical protein
MAEGQSRRMSVVESVANVAVGFGIAIATQMLVFPLFGIQISVGDDLLIGLIFTVVSLVRSYCLRRVFNHLSKRTTT